MTQPLHYLAVDATLHYMGSAPLKPEDREAVAGILRAVQPGILQLFCVQLQAMFTPQAPRPLLPVQVEQAVQNAVIAAHGGMLAAMINQEAIRRSPDVMAFTQAAQFFQSHYAAQQQTMTATAATPTEAAIPAAANSDQPGTAPIAHAGTGAA